MSASCCSPARLELVFANLLLRLWIALRLFFAGLDKFRSGSGTDATFNLDNYEKKMGAIASLTHNNGFLPEAACNMYAKPLGYLLLVGGVWAAIGLFSRLGLFFCGLVFLSLGVGLATLPDDTEVLYIGMHVLIVAAALATNEHNKLSLDGLLFRGRSSAPAPASESAEA
jgi:uncharacterized membrane protein YphA (DoxX/SURF4 family)